MFRTIATAFGLTFVAELGDKTQVAILTLSARYGWLPVFLGASCAFAVLNLLAVTAGGALGRYVPPGVVRGVSAAVFIVFGLLALAGRDGNDGEEAEGQAGKNCGKTRNPFLAAFLYVTLMELGDKTQLSLVALTSRFRMPAWVFLGGTLALILTSFIGAIIGRWLARAVPVVWIRRASGVLFVAFGVLTATGVL